jgi:hypothetical protein
MAYSLCVYVYVVQIYLHTHKECIIQDDNILLFTNFNFLNVSYWSKTLIIHLFRIGNPVSFVSKSSYKPVRLRWRFLVIVDYKESRV